MIQHGSYTFQLEEQKQAKVYEEFVREFEHDAPKVKTFVKGDVINSESSKWNAPDL